MAQELDAIAVSAELTKISFLLRDLYVEVLELHGFTHESFPDYAEAVLERFRKPGPVHGVREGHESVREVR